MAVELTEKQARYIADYIEHEYSEIDLADLELSEVILDAVSAINGGAME